MTIKELKELNTNLVKKEFKSIYCIIKGLNEYEHNDKNIIFLTFNGYLILILIEMVNYLECNYNQKIQFKLKSKLKSCRF